MSADIARARRGAARVSDGARSRAPKGAQTVLRALDILAALDDRSATLSLSEIARKVGLTLPTTHRLLRALASRDFVVFDADARRFSIGPAIVRLAGVISRRDDIIAVAMPSLERLAELTKESIGLHYRIGTRRVCLVELVAPHPIRMSSGVGRAYPLAAGAAGKAILAWSADSLVDVVTSSAVRANGRASAAAKKLLRDLAGARKVGYATSFGETVTGASAIAAPILDHQRVAIAAVNITGPSNRWTRGRMLRAAPALIRETRLIMRRLGHEPSPSGGNGTRANR